MKWFLPFFIISFLGCSVRHKEEEVLNIHRDSTYQNDLFIHSATDNRISTDVGTVFMLSKDRPKFIAGQNLEQYEADNAYSITEYSKKETVKDSSGTKVDQGHGNVSLVSAKKSIVKTADSSFKTAWVWIIALVAALLIIALIFLRHLKLI